MILIESCVVLNNSSAEIFKKLAIPELSKEDFPHIESIERKAPNILVYEGETYKINILQRGLKSVQTVCIRKVLQNKEISCDGDVGFIFYKTSNVIEEISDRTKLTIIYEMNFKNRMLILFEGLFSRALSKAMKTSLETLYKSMDSNFDSKDMIYKVRVWKIDPRWAYFLNMSFIFIVSFLVALSLSN